MHLAEKTDKSRIVTIYFSQRIRREVEGYIIDGTLVPEDFVLKANIANNEHGGYYSSLTLPPDAVIDQKLVIATNTKEECIRVNYRGRPHFSNCDWTWTLIPINIIDRVEITETRITTLTIEHGLSWGYVKKEHEQHGERGPCAFEGCETEPCPTYRKQKK